MKLALLYNRDAIEPPADPVIEQVCGALTRAGHAVEQVVIDDTVEPVIDSLKRIEPELVFNLSENFGGRSALDSNVAALLNLLDLRYTGSSPAGLMLAGDKALAKKVLSFHGLKTPEFATIFRGAVDWAGDIDFPLIVKPPQEDGSVGLHTNSVVRDLKELLTRLDELHSKYQQPIMIEKFIEGREFYIGVLGNAQAEALPIIELDFTGYPDHLPKIASWEAKWGDDENPSANKEYAGTKSVIAKDLDEELDERMRQIAVEVFQSLRLRDYARIDLRVAKDGGIFILEANPNCYLESGSEFARAAQEAGTDYDALIGRILELSLARYAH